jgi:hypothetical protein
MLPSLSSHPSFQMRNRLGRTRLGIDTALQRYRGPLLLMLTGAALVSSAMANHPQAEAQSLFGAEPVSSGSTLAIAQPLGNDRWTLAVVERLLPGRHCWREQSDGSVKLRTEDFLRPGLCRRVQSSSSYSLRAAGEDLPTTWRLRIEAVGNRLELQAFNPSQPTPIVIGVGQKPSANRMGAGSDIVPAFSLNPGWGFEKRSYEGRLLSHVYLSSPQPIGAELNASRPLLVAPPPLPTRAEPRMLVSPQPDQVIALEVVPFRNP